MHDVGPIFVVGLPVLMCYLVTAKNSKCVLFSSVLHVYIHLCICHVSCRYVLLVCYYTSWMILKTGIYMYYMVIHGVVCWFLLSAFGLHLLLLVSMLFLVPTAESSYVLFIILGAWGVADGTIFTQTTSTYHRLVSSSHKLVKTGLN